MLTPASLFSASSGDAPTTTHFAFPCKCDSSESMSRPQYCGRWDSVMSWMLLHCVVTNHKPTICTAGVCGQPATASLLDNESIFLRNANIVGECRKPANRRRGWKTLHNCYVGLERETGFCNARFCFPVVCQHTFWWIKRRCTHIFLMNALFKEYSNYARETLPIALNNFHFTFEWSPKM